MVDVPAEETCAVCGMPTEDHDVYVCGCHTPYRLSPEDVDFDEERVTCHACGAQKTFDAFGEMGRFLILASVVAEANRRPAPPLSLPPRPVEPRPPGFRVEQDERHALVTWREFGARHVGLALLGTACGLAWVCLSHGLVGRARPGLGLFFGVLGMLLAWGALTGLRRVVIEATGEGLGVRRELGGWRREGPRVERRELVQLYGKAVGGLRQTYGLCALTRDGRGVILASGFARKQPVLYLEQLLEGQLGIQDGLVKGELAERPPGAGERLHEVPLPERVVRRFTVTLPLDTPPPFKPPK